MNQPSAIQKKETHSTVNSLPKKAELLLTTKLNQLPDKEIIQSDALKLIRFIWPAVFQVTHPKPLKIGIHKDIIAQFPQIRPSIIAKALHLFTNQMRYLESLKLGATRINLNGDQSGYVRLKEAVDAEIKLFRNHEIAKDPSQYKDNNQNCRKTYLLNKIRILKIQHKETA